MKVLILGANGLLGHRLLIDLAKRHDVFGTLKNSKDRYNSNIFNNCYFSVDALDLDSVEKVLRHINPDVVINTIGLIKQKDISTRSFYEINSIFPYRLYSLCQKYNSFLIQLSSVCIWSGKDGNYTEESIHDSKDDYGLSKSLGELKEPGTLTIRTSFIGPEISDSSGLGLFNWFVKQKKASGYPNEIFSGLTTYEISEILLNNLEKLYFVENKIYNLAGPSISKYELLEKINKSFNLNIDLSKNEDHICDRSFLSNKFNNDFNYIAPNWDILIEQMKTNIRREGIYDF